MIKRLKILGVGVALMGLAFLAAGGYSYWRYQEGTASLKAYSQAQQVTLSYNEDGQLVDRGEVAGAEAIMALLTEDWKYPVNMADFNADDPVVNTASEYMYQMATISYHVLHGTQTITLAEPVEYNGETFPAGEYEFAVDGRYYSQFDRQHPIEGPARTMAWSPLALSLISNLGVATGTASALEMGLGLAGAFLAVGLALLVIGVGLVWAVRPETVTVPVAKPAVVPTPA